jgi:hypothetical protein
VPFLRNAKRSPKCVGFELVDAQTIHGEALALSFEGPINAFHNPKAAESSCSRTGGDSGLPR